MACPGGCPKNKTAVSATDPVFSFSTRSPTVTGKDGRPYSVTTCLVEAGNRPRRGWSVVLPIKGHLQTIAGSSARAVHDTAASMLRTNQVEFTELDLWYNLNLQWLQRVQEHRQKVRHADLMQIAIGNAPPPVAHAKKGNTPPAIWGRKGWGNLQMYLAGNVYEYAGFLRRAIDLGELVNPDLNPSIGCATCFQHYSAALEVLKRTPIYSQQDARMWLFNLMNEVNKRRIAEGDSRARILTYEQAAQANYWN